MNFTQGSTCCHLPAEMFTCQQPNIYTHRHTEKKTEREMYTHIIITHYLGCQRLPPKAATSIFEQEMFIKSNSMSKSRPPFAMIHIWMSEGRSLEL